MKVYADRVTTTYQIKDVAEISGFTPATLRFYEQIGLLPHSVRTAAGYRTYDAGTLDRLAFIARAKQLGCTLDEIADLTIAWEGGRCGPVQDRLRDVVAEKLASSQRQIAQLMRLSSELQRAAATLELHRPDGACDDRCGCITDDVVEPMTPQAISLVAKPATTNDIACTLAAASMHSRLGEWQRSSCSRHPSRIRRGWSSRVFGEATPLDELMRLTAAEQECCKFFDFAITIDSRGVALEVRSSPDALPIIHSLFGVPA